MERVKQGFALKTIGISMILAHDFRSHVGTWNRDFGPLDLFTVHLAGADAVKS